MNEEHVSVKSVRHVTHDVLQIKTEKPEGMKFTPGQATEISIDKDGWQNEGRPFTFTSLPDDDYLEFTTKTYPAREGVTNELLQLKPGDGLILHDVFGAIAYQGEGTFIAGGAGVTPFISILRALKVENKLGGNKLIFANKTQSDIILKEELGSMLSKNFINILSKEETDGYFNGHITEEFIKAHCLSLNKAFYLCGPPPMIDEIEKQLANLQVSEKLIVKEGV